MTQDIIPSEPDTAQPNATPAAQAHADATGVDLSQVQGTGAGGKITKQDVEENSASLLGWYYCLNENHPGTPNYQSEPFNLGRQFQAPADEGAPVCPACGIAGNSLYMEGEDKVPQFILDAQERFGR